MKTQRPILVERVALKPTAPALTASCHRGTPDTLSGVPVSGGKKPKLTGRQLLLRRRRARHAGRVADSHGAEIKHLLDEAAAANGGKWPGGVHAVIADRLGLKRGHVHAFLGTLVPTLNRSKKKRKTPPMAQAPAKTTI